jgi:hypothetical protein
MKGGLNKIMRNITASAESKTDFEKVKSQKITD